MNGQEFELFEKLVDAVESIASSLQTISKTAEMLQECIDTNKGVLHVADMNS